ncbi:hypothetical protein AAZX31_17G067100 [Glycine max]
MLLTYVKLKSNHPSKKQMKKSDRGHKKGKRTKERRKRKHYPQIQQHWC